MTPRRFPGVLFRSESPARVDVLPRMDVAAFVGFASSGPLHTPVLVEDPLQFRDIFGTAPALAWDPETGSLQYACLAAAVESFFAQGGTRCYAVRVAGDTAVNRFPIPGLLQDDGSGLVPVVALARSAGSWSDGIRTRPGLEAEPLVLHASQASNPGERMAMQLHVPAARPLQIGDLVYLEMAEDDERAGYLAIDEIADAGPDVLESARFQRVEGAAHWFEPHPLGEQPGTILGVRMQASAPGTLVHDADGTLELRHVPVAAATFVAGDWLTFLPATGGAPSWLLAGESRIEASTQGGETRHLVISLRTAWRKSANAPTTPPERASRLTLRLDVESTDGRLFRLEGLGFDSRHQRAFMNLPNDEALFANTGGTPVVLAESQTSVLRQQVLLPRFPLAAPAAPGLILPLGLSPIPRDWSPALVPDDDAMRRDGLVPPAADIAQIDSAAWSTFLPSLFLDPGLESLDEASLLEQAWDIRFAGRSAGNRGNAQGRQLRGIHSVLPLEEVSLIAIPDAMQRGWHFAGFEEPHVDVPTVVAPPAHSEPGLFQACHAVELPPGPGPQPPAASPPVQRWQVLPANDFDATGLLAAQAAAVRMSAARADLIAVLGMPQHYQADRALAHVQALRAGFTPGSAAMSYCTVYHPWLIQRSEGDLRRIGPEGAASGLIAASAAARGAWIAPGNEPVRDALAVEPRMSRADLERLFAWQINSLVIDPRGVAVIGADTLSTDGDLRPLGVRRLLILLRKLALREGETFVFEPQSPEFRRRVAFGFEQQLAGMFARGAFAGKDAASAFRVVVDDSLNSRESIEQGRFIVELRVAPALPLTFLTVRLIQTSTGSSVTEGA